MATLATGIRRSSATALVVLIFLVVLLNYVDRGAIGVGAPLMMPEMGLSATQFGIAVSAFFWIYAPAQFAVGWAIDRWCVYRLMAFGVFLWGLATAATGLVDGLALLVICRLLLGLGEAFTFPAANKVIARYVPAERRGIANSAIAMGLSFGPAVGTLTGGLIAAAYGWRAMFVLFGLLTLLWVVPWLMVARSLPDYKSEGRDAPVPYSSVATHPVAWLMGVAHLTATFTHYFALVWFPLFLVKSQGMSMVAMSQIAGLGFLAQGLAAAVHGWASDRWTRAGRDEGQFRRWANVLSYVLYVVAIWGLMNAEGEREITLYIVLVCIAAASSGVHNYAVGQIFAGPRYAGSFVGFFNGLGNMSGIFGPIVVGMTIDATGSYQYAFLLAGAFALLGAIIWAFVVPPIRPLTFRDANVS